MSAVVGCGSYDEGEPMNDELERAIVVELPLRGEGWVAVTSPADRVPSHGTDMLGLRYAYDFILVDARRGMHYHRAGWLRTLLVGVPTRECFAWGAPIHAPFEGVIVRAGDGFAERSRVHPVREAILAAKHALTFRPARLPSILGNHVIMQGGSVYAAFAHLAPGSVSVREGQRVALGEVIGRVGHTGNSTSPHLHFQLMDDADPIVARAVACAFRSYEVLRAGRWERVENGMPRSADRIRLASVQLPGPAVGGIGD
jgi:hypothetical protein